MGEQNIENRMEKIKQARQSFTKYPKENEKKKSPVHYYSPETELNMESDISRRIVKIRFFFFRVIAALILFGFIVAIDYFHLSYESLNSDTVMETLQSNQRMQQAEQWIYDVLENKSTSVWNPFAEEQK